MKFSVLMSVYEKENPVFLRNSLESILEKQTVIPSEVIVVEDGPLGKELYAVLEEFKSKFPFFKTIFLSENSGLGFALNEGLKHCTHNWVARMDSDDIAISTRFEKQIAYITKHPEIDIVGGEIDEFLDDVNEAVSHKSVPAQHDDIVKMSKRRNPMCHMTVMFKKNIIERAGGYQPLPYVEDYYLWVRAIVSGAKLANLDETLVNARIGNGMFTRRGNKEQITSWSKLNKYMLEHKLITNLDLVINLCYIRAFVYMPTWMKKFIYGKLLRG